MGAHRTNKGLQTKKDGAPPLIWPELSNNIGKIRSIRAIDGHIRYLSIEDEIIHPQSNSKRKIIVLQKMKFIQEDRIEFRFGYYMIGMKPKAKRALGMGPVLFVNSARGLNGNLGGSKKAKVVPTRQPTYP